MKKSVTALLLFLAYLCTLAFLPAEVSRSGNFPPRIRALVEIMEAIEKHSFYKLTEKELDKIQECMAGRAFTGLEIKRGETLKNDLKIPSCFPQDERAVYFNPDMSKEMRKRREGHFSGIGIVISKDTKTGGAVIREIFSDGPVDKDGQLRVGDVIVSAGDFVEGEKPELKELKDLDIGQIVKIITGPPATKVYLEALRDGRKLPPIVLTRKDIEIPNVSSKKISTEIVYLKIRTFSDFNTAGNVFLELKNLGDVKKLIIDLRNNPGGLMHNVLSIASFFGPWPGRPILEMRRRGQKSGEGTVFRSPPTISGIFSGLKIVVLVNEHSASASEILAGSLKIWNATIVGTKTYGKGTVQSVLQLPDGGEFHLTTAYYYLANGKTPEKNGIKPHSIVKDDPRTVDIDEVLDKAIDILMGE